MHDSHRETHPAESLSDTPNALAALAGAMRLVMLSLDASEAGSPLDVLVRAAAAQVPGATEASVTMLRHGRFSTVASTGGAEEASVQSALSYRLTVLDHPGTTTATLNIYSEQPDAFDEVSVNTGRVLATHGSLLVTAMLARESANNLARALESNREIGVAMGILMQRHRLTREQAFHILSVASQEANRKVADIATEVADTGILAIRCWPGSTTPTAEGSTDGFPAQRTAHGPN